MKRILYAIAIGFISFFLIYGAVKGALQTRYGINDYNTSIILGNYEFHYTHQLRLLRSLGLVKYRSEGKMAFYTLDNEHVMRLIDEGIRHIEKG